MAMAPLHPTTPVEVLPLHTTTTNNDNDNNHQQRLIVHDASSLRGSSSAVLSNDSVNDGGDVIAFIQHHHVDTNNRQVVVQRMDGTDIASFALPADTNNNHNAASSRQKQRNNGNNNKNELSEWSEGYQNQVLCWASFHKQQQQHESDNKNTSSSIGGRKMLCVLGNQNTLLVFDVLGDTAILATTGNHSTANNTTLSNNNNKSNGDDDDDAGGGPGGHTISLPFRAQSIYPVPNGCGLIVVRTPSEEDYVAAVQDEEEEALSHSLVSDGGGGGLLEGEAATIPPPPSALGMSLPATPRRQYIEGKTNEDDDELSLEIGPPDPLRFGVANNNNNIQNSSTAVVGLLPCLFTLRHPLDEIRPVATTTTTTTIVPSQMDDDEEGGVGMGVINNSMTDSPLRDGITTDMTEDNDTDQEKEEEQLKLDLFTDVNETLVHVGSPRLFHHPIYSSSESSNSGGGSSATSSPPMVCVTYNEALKRHTIWSLSKSKSDVEEVPLWKSTGRGVWREQEMTTTEKIDEEEEDAVMEEEEEEEEEVLQTTSGSRGVAVTSSFSDIHPDFTLTKVFVEDDGKSSDDVMDDEEELDGDLAAAITTTKRAGEKALPRYQRNVFLATDTVGNGDLVLCIFMPNDNKQQLGNDDVAEPAILRCYSLNLSSLSSLSSSKDDNKQNNDAPVLVDSVSHVKDVACSSAQPVQSIPIPLKPFSRKGDKGHRSSSRFQSKD
eukprot:scaffold206_cov147-Skeletonema_marinoi.AAC.1